ncbi:MAG TPA: ATP-binding protein [Candidatus Dormibacteraeota bacterium]|nr:ATP-binding protein [Candidatus Dormibacteraeota bacterium]
MGLPFSFICDLVLKVLYFNGNVLGRDLGALVCLPWSVTSEAVAFLTKETYCGTTGARTATKSHEDFAEGLEYVLTATGRERARETLQLSQYSGPAPVPFDDYLAGARSLATDTGEVSAASMREALGDLVISNSVVDIVGSALTARQALFLFGPPGNGKSSIADACAAVLGSPIFIPHALYVHGEVVRVFDPVHHRPVEGPPISHDRRWTLVYRPVVRTGGELRAQQLEPAFDRVLGFYEAPLQVKANGGIFHVDDFGRQVISPREILNRLIVPLETGVDHLNIARAGTTVSVPYATILLLSTNLDPSELVDEAFLRRVRYKALVGDPGPDEFRTIFRQVCQDSGLTYDDDAVDYLLETHYIPKGRPLRGCQPRDLVGQISSTARYLGKTAELSYDLIDRAANAYFADFRYAAGLIPEAPPPST